MTSEQNAVFTQSDGERRRVEIGLHQCDICWYGSQGWWNLLLWLASVTTVFAACHMSCLYRVFILENSAQHIGHAMSSDINISHGSVATLLRRGGICNDVFIANFLLSVTVKEFWKSVIIWRSYGQEFGVLFLLDHGVDVWTTDDRQSVRLWTLWWWSSTRCSTSHWLRLQTITTTHSHYLYTTEHQLTAQVTDWVGE